ncbi:MAG: hypothetical protein VYA62_05675 [Planctomycetota bacterium]|nr:hypothetical protein [Planctomycetota bacterium]
MSISGGDSGWTGFEVADSGATFVVDDGPSPVVGSPPQPTITRTAKHAKYNFEVFIIFPSDFFQTVPSSQNDSQSRSIA